MLNESKGSTKQSLKSQCFAGLSSNSTHILPDTSLSFYYFFKNVTSLRQSKSRCLRIYFAYLEHDRQKNKEFYSWNWWLLKVRNLPFWCVFWISIASNKLQYKHWGKWSVYLDHFRADQPLLWQGRNWGFNFIFFYEKGFISEVRWINFYHKDISSASPS